MPRLSDRDVLAEVRSRVASAQGGDGSTLSREREKALRYYRGDPFGGGLEVDGRSQVVSRDVAQYVDSQMPPLLRIFTSGDEVARFEPNQPEDEERAAQATDYVNWIWSQQNHGFANFHHWFKDGLLHKLGTVKIWWQEEEEVTSERYQRLTAEQLEALRANSDVEVEVTAETPDLSAAPMAAPGGPVVPDPPMVYDARVMRTNLTGRARVEPVPPEEMLIGQQARNDRDVDVLAHATKRTRSALIANGYPRSVIDRLPQDQAIQTEKQERFEDVDDTGLPGGGRGSEEEVEWVEAYLRMDRDDDGVSEMLRVCYSGSEVLEIEEVDDHPFAFVSPVLMPHRLIGLSTADQTMDIQLIKSTVLRQILDNLYLTNMPQVGAVEGKVNLDDLLTRRPGGVVRMKEANAVLPIPTPTLGQEPYAMIEYLDTQGEQRTGSTRYNQGMDADTLNKTATGINIIQNASQQRLELIARVYAETGVKRAFQLILKLICKHQEKARIIRLRGKWVPMDPREWDAKMDMTISVGLGTGNRDQQAGHLMSLLQLDKEIMAFQGGANGPLVTLPNVYAKLKRVVEALGFKGVEAYYTDPASAPPQEPKPDPKMVEFQAKMRLEQQEAQHKAQLAQQAAENEMQLAQRRAEHEFALEQWKAQQAMALERDKMTMRAQLEAVQMNADIATKAAWPREAAPAG